MVWCLHNKVVEWVVQIFFGGLLVYNVKTLVVQKNGSAVQIFRRQIIVLAGQETLISHVHFKSTLHVVTMPNLGQGGAMAIEDAYALGQCLEGIQHTDEIPARLQAYEKRRFV